MADQATQTTTMHADAARCWQVAVDVESYPQWARDVKEAVVDERDAEGRPLEVSFRAAGLGRSVRYTLRYDYSDAPDTLSWQLVDSDLLRQLDGTYHFEADDDGTTTVTYHLTAELKIPLPGFVKRTAERLIMSTALESMKDAVEAGQ